MYTIPHRSLGNTGLTVSEIGLGCNRIGEGFLSDEEWIRLLHQASDWGITVFDTAARYSDGRSEELIGKAFGNRQDVIIATKVSPIKIGDGRGFTRESIIEGAEKSLRILKRDRIDIFQTHGRGSLVEMRDSPFADAMNH